MLWIHKELKIPRWRQNDCLVSAGLKRWKPLDERLTLTSLRGKDESNNDLSVNDLNASGSKLLLKLSAPPEEKTNSLFKRFGHAVVVFSNKIYFTGTFAIFRLNVAVYTIKSMPMTFRICFGLPENKYFLDVY